MTEEQVRPIGENLVSTPLNALIAYHPIALIPVHQAQASPKLKRPNSLKVKKIEVDPEKKKAKPPLEDYNVYKVDKSDIVKLNIGGKLFSTYKSTLVKKISKPNTDDEFYAPNLLEELLNGKTEARLDESNAIFIDRNPCNFEFILDYLRMANTNAEFQLPPRDVLKSLEKDCEYFKINGLKELLLFYDSNILTKSLKIDLIKLCDIKLNEIWRLVYRASADGFSAASFHSKCDGVSRTLTIIKTCHSNIFGGYTEAAWSQVNAHVSDPNAYVFSLINKDKKPILLRCSNPANAIYCGSNYGPTFGEGHDFYISNNSNVNNYSLSNLGFTYRHPHYSNGSNNTKIFLAGSHNFQTTEIEVYAKS